jgi:hypothetical protein
MIARGSSRERCTSKVPDKPERGEAQGRNDPWRSPNAWLINERTQHRGSGPQTGNTQAQKSIEADILDPQGSPFFVHHCY